MTPELHNFLTGPFWLKLKADVADMRVFNKQDLVAATYFHIRRLLLVRPGWMCRSALDTQTGQADLVLFLRDRFEGILQLECLLKTEVDNYFPADMLGQKMDRLRNILASFEKKNVGRAYLFGVFDTKESWFFPNESTWEKQSCFWVPINCQEFPRHDEWRQKWEKLVKP